MIDTSRCVLGTCRHKKLNDRYECQRILRRERVKRLETIKSLCEQELAMHAVDRYREIDLPMPGTEQGSDTCPQCLQLLPEYQGDLTDDERQPEDRSPD